MNSRSFVLGALAMASIVAGCEKQPAGPHITVDNTNTGGVVLYVLADTATGVTPKYVRRSGIRFNLTLPGDTVVLRSNTSDANGRVNFQGLETGVYVVKPALRPLSATSSPESILVFIQPGFTDSSSVFNVRPGARITGTLAWQYFNQEKQIRAVIPNVEVIVMRETAFGSNVYTEFVRDTTLANGTYEAVVPPGAAKYRIKFKVGAVPAGASDSMKSTIDTTKGFADTVSFTSTVGINPDANLTQNFTYEYTSRISGIAFRDNNNNGIYDGASENLVAGDTVIVQLRNAEGTRAITTSRALATGGAYSFTSLQAGTYKLTIDLVGSRFPSNPYAFVRSSSTTVTLPTSSSKASRTCTGTVTTECAVNVPVPFGP